VSSGQLRKHERFRSRFLRNQRDIIVYLPPGYDEQRSAHFPVLYLHDGQNLFDGTTSFVPGMHWRVRETADQCIGAAAVQQLVIVGIYNAGKARAGEYTPTRDARAGGGRADRYAKFLLQELIPFVRQEYRILGGPMSTGIGGSSLGGLASLYIGLTFPEIFGRIAALSPSIWWDQRAILRFARDIKVASRPRIWLDAGTSEGSRTVKDAEQLRDMLLKKGWRLSHDLHYEAVEGGEHNEAAWAQRVGPFLQFLFPAGEGKV
jgi:predicted alpha/beta superfamily hydrolase